MIFKDWLEVCDGYMSTIYKDIIIINLLFESLLNLYWKVRNELPLKIKKSDPHQ